MCLNLITIYLFHQFIKLTCKKKRLHMREGVGKYNIHCEPKSFNLKFLGKLIVQHNDISYSRSLSLSLTHTHMHASTHRHV